MKPRDKILLVDDNPTNIAILEEILEEDYQVAIAICGKEALVAAPDFRPDMILLDVMMPGIDGYETCRQIRANPTLKNTKIMMVSAKALVSERLQGYDAGVNDYITKPFDKDELLAKVRVYLRLKCVEEVDQLKSDVISLLNHESGTPLNIIFLALDLLRSEDTMEAEEQQAFFEDIHQSAKQLHHLFQKVTTLSALKAGSREFAFAEKDLCEVINEAVYEMAGQAETRGIRIEEDLPETASTLVDPRQMKEVVKILLDNAIRFSPAQGCVAIRIVQESDAYLLSVSDEGKGIDPDFLPQVFDEFTTPDVMHHSAGHGLNLAIARHIVAAHNGTITVESTPGERTTFTVRLPIATSEDEILSPLEAAAA